MDRHVHLGLYPQCGICVQVIEFGETSRAIYRDSPNTFSCTVTDCHKCTISPETVPVHNECYALFMRECVIKDKNAAYMRLWAVAAWRKPWKDAQPLFLSYRLNIGMAVPETVAKRVGLSGLTNLPIELVEVIRGQSKGSLFWRYASAASLAAYISETKDQPRGLQTALLREVSSWKRDGTIMRGSPESLPPIIKITIDFNGIASISRHFLRPEYSGECSSQNAYIVAPEDDETFCGVEVHLIHGRLRLALPVDAAVPHIWNTPAPPLLPSCSMSIAKYHAFAFWPRFTAVEPDAIRGMTFFLDQGNLYNIHMHYPGGPPALETFKSMGFEFQSQLVWIYLPIAEGDRLTKIGMRRNLSRPFNLLARTEKSGTTIIGPHQDAFRHDCFGNTAPLTFIHQQMRRGTTSRNLAFLGTYSPGAPTKDLGGDFPLDEYERGPLCVSSPFETIYFSWAPLDYVASTVVYNDRHTGVCKGILVHYLNGGCRALGECRVGVDLAHEVVDPFTVCIRTKIIVSEFDLDRITHHAWVEFQNDWEHQHPSSEEWACKPVTKCLKFWCTKRSSFLAVRSS